MKMRERFEGGRGVRLVSRDQVLCTVLGSSVVDQPSGSRVRQADLMSDSVPGRDTPKSLKSGSGHGMRGESRRSIKGMPQGAILSTILFGILLPILVRTLVSLFWPHSGS